MVVPRAVDEKHVRSDPEGADGRFQNCSHSKSQIAWFVGRPEAALAGDRIDNLRAVQGDGGNPGAIPGCAVALQSTLRGRKHGASQEPIAWAPGWDGGGEAGQLQLNGFQLYLR